MSHVTYESDMSHAHYLCQQLDKSCHIWIDWFLLRGWLINKGAICASTATLLNFNTLFGEATNEISTKNRKSKSVYESCRVWMSHATYEWVMSHMNELCHTWMSHVAYEWVMPRTKESCHIWISHVTYARVVSHINKSYINKSCHVWMSHVAYEWVISHMNEPCRIWISHVTYERVTPHMNESCHIWMSHATYKWAMSHEWVMSRMNEIFPPGAGTNNGRHVKL